MRRYKSVRTVLAALALTPVLVACGGSGGGANALPSASGGNNAASSGPSQSPQQQQANYDACMTKRGYPPVKPGTPRNITNQDDFKNAMDSCSSLLGHGKPETASPEGEKKMAEAWLKVAKCMRAKGYNYPDPTSNGSGLMTSNLKLAPGQSAAQAQTDEAACAGQSGAGTPITGSGTTP